MTTDDVKNLRNDVLHILKKHSCSCYDLTKMISKSPNFDYNLYNRIKYVLGKLELEGFIKSKKVRPLRGRDKKKVYQVK